VEEFLGIEMVKDAEKCHHSNRCYRQRRVQINPGQLWKLESRRRATHFPKGLFGKAYTCIKERLRLS
jgi:hypothetical protein